MDPIVQRALQGGGSLDVYHHFPEEGHGTAHLLHEILTLTRALEAQGVTLMAGMDDLKAGQVVQKGIVDTIGQEVAGVAAEVTDLLARLAAGTGGPDFTQALADLADSNTRLQAAADALKAIPAAPRTA